MGGTLTKWAIGLGDGVIDLGVKVESKIALNGVEKRGHGDLGLD